MGNTGNITDPNLAAGDLTVGHTADTTTSNPPVDPVKEKPGKGTSYSRSTVSLNMPVKLTKVLVSHSKHYVRDFERHGNVISAAELSEDVQLPVPDCELIIKAAGQKFDCSRIQSVHKVLQHEVRENRFQKIGSSCPALDLLLTGGIRIGDLTELYGEAGSGKTQLCLQLCINVQMPKSQDGHEAEAAFLDCENGFRSERLLQMAAASAEQWFDPPVDASLMLRKVHHMRCTSADILRNAVMYELEQFLSDHPQVRLLVLDGMPFVMRFGYESDMRERTKLLDLIAHQLRLLAQKKDIAVVITNQMTYSMDKDKVIPALGKNWSSTCSTKICLKRGADSAGNTVRTATLDKSPLTGQRTGIQFRITDQGIC